MKKHLMIILTSATLFMLPMLAMARNRSEELSEGGGLITAGILFAIYTYVYFKDRAHDAVIGMAITGGIFVLLVAVEDVPGEVQWAIIIAAAIGYFAYTKIKKKNSESLDDPTKLDQ